VAVLRCRELLFLFPVERDVQSGRFLRALCRGHRAGAAVDRCRAYAGGAAGVLRVTGDSYLERAPGLLEVRTTDGVRLLQTAGRNLSSIESAEVRALILADEQGDELLAAALSAPTLAQLTARVDHADLLPLFASELESFRCVYQPIVTLADGEQPAVVGYEALLRARTTTGELMPQAMFAAAERAGWSHVLDRVGRTTALRGAAGWLGDALLFVNFLPTTFYRPEVCLATTERAAEQAGLRLDQLVFEVTESEQVNDLDHIVNVLAYYRERGCKVGSRRPRLRVLLAEHARAP